MRFNFGIVLVAFATFLIIGLCEAKVGKPNSFKSPRPSGICVKNKKCLKPADGTQIRNGFCSSQIFGEVPSADHIVSTIIVEPQNGAVVKQHKNFTVRVKSIHLNTGFFSDAETDYYDLPQKLGKNGFINGHNHIVVQALKGPQDVLDPTVFAFFKGLNDPADGSGVLSQIVGTKEQPGLPEGQYRLCTMVSSFTHQPLIMPVAQRGSQDDCIRFSVK